MSATAVPASACLSATPICSSVNPFLGILRASFPGASLPEKLRWDWIKIRGQDHALQDSWQSAAIANSEMDFGQSFRKAPGLYCAAEELPARISRYSRSVSSDGVAPIA